MYSQSRQKEQKCIESAKHNQAHHTGGHFVDAVLYILLFCCNDIYTKTSLVLLHSGFLR